MLYDLSQPIENGMSYFPGDPEPRVTACPMDPPWRVSTVHLGSHTGTHLDAPSHIGGAGTMDDVPIERLIAPAVIVDVTGKGPGERIGLDDVSPAARELLRQGLGAVLRTGWSRYWRTPAYLDHPSLDAALARALAAWGVNLVAVDLLNPDETASGAWQIHQILLDAGVLIAENLASLDRLQANRVYTLALLPLKLAGLDGAPVRAVAWDERETIGSL